MTNRETIDEIDALEQSGQYHAAASRLLHLAGQLGKDESLPVLHRAGINFRLAGEFGYSNAERCFKKVIEESRDGELRSRVMRDFAMLRIDQRRVAEAYQLLFDAIDIQHTRNYNLELAVSISFLGRLRLEEGDRSTARDLMRAAYCVVRPESNNVYTLNVLIWLLKTEQPIRRIALLPSALSLAYKTKYRRRGLEAVLITVSPRLYTRFRELRS